MAEPAAPASAFSLALIAALVRAGLRDVVVCPGSRSQALALAAARAEAAGSVRLHVRVDERTAGFLALGLAVESGLPALVVTTSGTATANLHPAVLEAHQAGVPLLVGTADRPEEAHGVRSNQTTDQRGLYGAAVRAELHVPAPTGAPGEGELAERTARRAFALALGTDTLDPGPVHLNLAFREPLSSPLPPATAVGAAATAEDTARSRGGAEASASGPADAADPAPGGSAAPGPEGRIVLERGPRTVVVAGAGAGDTAEGLAHAGGWPLLAEAVSGARFGRHAIAHYRELLREAELGGGIERVVVYGAPTLSREVPALLRREGVSAVVAAPTGHEFFDPARSARVARRVEVAQGPSPVAADEHAWLGSWVLADRALARADDDSADAPDVAAGRSYDPARRRDFARAELAAVREPVDRRMLVEAVWRFTWPHNRLVVGASRLARELDASVPGKRIPVHANRGLSGIDGTVSTALGVALASQRPVGDAPPPRVGHTRVLLGDLALLHDVGALLLGAGEPRPLLQVVVGNDGGGSIFDGLEVAGTADADAFERVMFTPQAVGIRALAEAYGWRYARAENRGELDRALSAPPDGVSILEVPLPR